MTSALSRTSFIMSVILRTSVATISEDAPRLHKLNSVLYSVSVCPGQCTNGLSLSQPYREEKNSQPGWLGEEEEKDPPSPDLRSSESQNHSTRLDLRGIRLSPSTPDEGRGCHSPAYFPLPTLFSMISEVELHSSWWSGPLLQELAYCAIHSHGSSTPHSHALKKMGLPVAFRAFD